MPVILITHVLPDAFAVTERIIVMHRGRKVAEKATASSSSTWSALGRTRPPNEIATRFQDLAVGQVRRTEHGLPVTGSVQGSAASGDRFAPAAVGPWLQASEVDEPEVCAQYLLRNDAPGKSARRLRRQREDFDASVDGAGALRSSRSRVTSSTNSGTPPVRSPTPSIVSSESACRFAISPTMRRTWARSSGASETTPWCARMAQGARNSGRVVAGRARPRRLASDGACGPQMGDAPESAEADHYLLDKARRGPPLSKLRRPKIARSPLSLPI